MLVCLSRVCCSMQKRSTREWAKWHGRKTSNDSECRRSGSDIYWATPRPNHDKPSHPHVQSWAIFLSEGFRGSVRAIPIQEPATLALKRRMGVRGSTQGPPLPKIDIRPTGFHMTGIRCPGYMATFVRQLWW